MTLCIAPSPFTAFSVVRVMRIDMAMMIPIRASTISTSIIEKPASRLLCRVVLIMGEPHELDCTFHARLFAQPSRKSLESGRKMRESRGRSGRLTGVGSYGIEIDLTVLSGA